MRGTGRTNRELELKKPSGHPDDWTPEEWEAWWDPKTRRFRDKPHITHINRPGWLSRTWRWFWDTILGGGAGFKGR